MMEQCLLAIAHGPVPGITAPFVTEKDIVVIVNFAKLGPGAERTCSDGRKRFTMPVLDDAPTINTNKWGIFRTESAAFAKIESERQALLAEGWNEYDFDPVGDPDWS